MLGASVQFMRRFIACDGLGLGGFMSSNMFQFNSNLYRNTSSCTDQNSKHTLFAKFLSINNSKGRDSSRTKLCHHVIPFPSLLCLALKPCFFHRGGTGGRCGTNLLLHKQQTAFPEEMLGQHNDKSKDNFTKQLSVWKGFVRNVISDHSGDWTKSSWRDQKMCVYLWHNLICIKLFEMNNKEW